MSKLNVVETELGKVERDKHEAEIAWSESRVRLARNGFCDRHPYIQLRKKNWRGKEKILRTTCPRCEEEHDLDMREKNLRLELLRQQLLAGGAGTSSLAGEPMAYATGQYAPWQQPASSPLPFPLQQQQHLPYAREVSPSNPYARRQQQLEHHASYSHSDLRIPEDLGLNGHIAFSPSSSNVHSEQSSGNKSPRRRWTMTGMKTASSKDSNTSSGALPQSTSLRAGMMTGGRNSPPSLTGEEEDRKLPPRSSSARAGLSDILEGSVETTEEDPISLDTLQQVAATIAAATNAGACSDSECDHHHHNFPNRISQEEMEDTSLNIRDLPQLQAHKKNHGLSKNRRYATAQARQVSKAQYNDEEMHNEVFWDTTKSPTTSASNSLSRGRSSHSHHSHTEKLPRCFRIESDDWGSRESSNHSSLSAASSHHRRRADPPTSSSARRSEQLQQQQQHVHHQHLLHHQQHRLSMLSQKDPPVHGDVTDSDHEDDHDTHNDRRNKSTPDLIPASSSSGSSHSHNSQRSLHTKDYPGLAVGLPVKSDNGERDSEENKHKRSDNGSLSRNKSESKSTSNSPSKHKQQQEDPIKLAKEEEKRRKKVGAIASAGQDSGSALQNEREMAKYAKTQGPLQQSATGVDELDLLSNESKKQGEEETPESKIQTKILALEQSCQSQVPSQAETVLHELQTLCQESEENQATVVMGGGLNTVIRCMTSFPLHAGVQEEACWVLGTLATENDDHKSLIAEAGGIRSMVSAMQNLSHHARFQETVCEVFIVLLNGHLLNKLAVCECGGVQEIVASMKHHLTHGGVQEKAISVLGTLALEGKNGSVCSVTGLPTTSGAQMTIAETGGIGAIFSAMMHHKFDAGLQECACGALGNIACRNTTAQFLIAQSGGVGFLLAAMRNHSNDAGIQEHACFALQSVAHDNLENKTMMIECGAIVTLLSVFKHFDTDVRVQLAICDTLITLIYGYDAGKEALAGLGGIAIMVNILEDSKRHAKLHQGACRVLMNLAHKHNYNKELIASSGGIAAILACMINYAKDVNIQECACKTLTSLTVNNQNKVLLANACGIDIIVAAMTNHSKKARIQEAGCRALLNLAYCDEIRECIAESNGVGAILEAMAYHPENVSIQEKACGALRELAVSDANEVFIVEMGGIDAIMTALKMHEGHAGIFRNACGALRNLSFSEEGTKQKIIESIGFGSLFAAMEQFMTDADSAKCDASHRSNESN